MKKRIIIVQLIISIMVLSLAGCAGSKSEDGAGMEDNTSTSSIQNENKEQEENDKPEPTETPKAEVVEEYSTKEEIEAIDISEDMLAYWMALNNKKPLVSANEGCQEFYWDEYFWHTSEMRPMYKTYDFGMVDLDNDGSDEMVLTGFMPETTQVLDYQEGKVYSYQFVYRAMEGICTNGVYGSSSGYDISGFYKIVSFDKGTYKEETLAYMEHDYYEVEGVEVSKEAFYAYTKPFTEAEQMKTMDFTEEALNEILLGNLGEEELSIVRRAEPEEICDENNPLKADVPEAYLAVLTGKEEFICTTEEGQKYRIDGNHIQNPTGEEIYQVLYFSMIDMEGDGEEEVVLTCVDDYWGKTLILHATEDSVYGYLYDFQEEVGVITQDGVFQVGYSYKETYARITSFEEDGYRIETVKSYDTSKHELVKYYFFSEEAIAQWLD